MIAPDLESEKATTVDEKHTLELLNIGGRRLAVKTAGEGVPTVVLEMGLGSPARTYDAIARQIAALTRVVWYDRAGLGSSDPAPMPRTIQDLVLDLHTLLQKAALPGPYVLAGHSMGGHIARLYCERYPDEVAALVLIDASHEDQRERYLTVLPPQPNELPDLAHLRHIWESRWADPRQNDEMIDNLANSALLRSCHSLGNLPLVVLSRGRPMRDPAKYPAGLIEEMERLWLQMQRELARLSSQSRHLIASKSGHLIHEDEPAAIVEVIQQMVVQVREQMKR
jgi:Predicted hydrolases or acyltransferases (alpha/beta hydrolase superfamily)